MKPIGLVYHDDYVKHDTGQIVYEFANGQKMNVGQEFENHNRLLLIMEMLDKSGLLGQMKRFTPEPASLTDLLRVHTSDHINTMVETARRGERWFGPEAWGCSLSEEIGRLSAGGAIKAVDIVMSDPLIKTAYALIRPPGHHATRELAMGYCIYNNIAIAARYAIETYGLERIAIVDWDVHHGNGTQDIFYHDEKVLFISLHEQPYFPMFTGGVKELGDGKGLGYNVNIPLPSGTGDAGYQYVTEHLVLPILEEYQPQLLLVSAGQDPSGLDPLSRMLLMRPGFRWMAKTMSQLAQKHCDGRLVVVQEGGYSLPYLPIATMGVFEGLMDCEVHFEDPHAICDLPIQADLHLLVDQYRQIFSPHWKNLV